MDLRKIVEDKLKPVGDSELLITESSIALNKKAICYPRDLIEDFKNTYYLYYIPIEFDELCFNLTFRSDWREVLIFRLKESVTPWKGNVYRNMSYILDTDNYE